MKLREVEKMCVEVALGPIDHDSTPMLALHLPEVQHAVSVVSFSLLLVLLALELVEARSLWPPLGGVGAIDARPPSRVGERANAAAFVHAAAFQLHGRRRLVQVDFSAQADFGLAGHSF